MSAHDHTPQRKVLQTPLNRGLERFSLVSALLLSASLLLCIPGVGYADAVALNTISFSNLQIIASTGTVQFQGAWNSQAFAQAQNSLGGLDSQFVSNTGGPAMVTATVLFASASGTALVASLSGAALSNASLPGNINAQALSTGTGTLFNFFEITGGTGSVNVTFSADLAGMLDVMTDQSGLLARTETIFTLGLDGQPILFFDSPLLVGSNDHASLAFAQTLSTTLSLNFNTPYLLFAQADSESQAINIPEPPTIALGFTALLGLAACVRKKRTQTA